MIDPNRPLPPWLEDAWMQRYLSRELNDAEAAAFEAYCLERMHLVARIEADTALRDVLAANRDLLPPSIESRPRARPRPWGALAACLLVGILSGVATWRFAPQGADVEGATTRVFFDSERSSRSPPRVDHAQSLSSHIVIDVVVPATAKNVRARLGEERWIPVSVATDGVASLLVRRQALRQRTLTLVYEQDGAVVERPLPLPALQFEP